MKEFGQHEYPLQEETYLLNRIAMEVHRILGRGFLEVVYKDALEYELKEREIPYKREKEYTIQYKKAVLPRKYNADFIVFDQIIVEAKAQRGIAEDHYSQTLNYLAVSKCKIGLIYNFGEPSLVIKRVIL